MAPPLTERYLQVLQWSGLQQYLAADRKVWKIGDDVAGYVRQVGGFMQVSCTYLSVSKVNCTLI